MKVTEKDLVGEIKDFPIHVVQEMCNNQVKQGNKFDPSVFALDKEATKNCKGFDWVKTDEGGSFWADVIRNQEKSFIEEYADDEIELLAEKPKTEPRKAIQISQSVINEPHYASPLWRTTIICNDGSIWTSQRGEKWERLPDIPQD